MTDDQKITSQYYYQLQEEEMKYGDIRYQSLSGVVEFGELFCQKDFTVIV